MTLSPSERFTGLLLGTAAGDAIGLPLESLSRARLRRWTRRQPLKHRLLPGAGLTSDDTEHACLSGQALLASQGDPERFARRLAWGLRGWLATLPAGIGFATLRACLKLCIGFPPSRSGVFSAGNGPAMRAAILGLWAASLGGSPEEVRERRRGLVRATTRLTHTDPMAEEGAQAVAIATIHGLNPEVDAEALFEELLAECQAEPLRGFLERAREAHREGLGLEAFADAIGCERGVTGFVGHTVPVVLLAWLRHLDDLRGGIEAVIDLGGDADTTAAILGGIAGARLGPESVPEPWLAGIVEWPRSVAWMRGLGAALGRAAEGAEDARPVGLIWPGYLLRSPLAMLIILAHALRRLAPPY